MTLCATSGYATRRCTSSTRISRTPGAASPSAPSPPATCCHGSAPPTGTITVEDLRIDEFADIHGYEMVPAILDCDGWLKLMRGGR